jgi:hypothetical protein
MANALMGFLNQPGRNLRRHCCLASGQATLCYNLHKVSEVYDDNSK